ncbi:hypothetical protein NDU88_009249 [Pleurodeles waltl]|uniref:Uncharacterized protein n=1 Tax=Pleurodeles waltl TaxID=8319 RepID=A0AAV7PS77_PLEWA|nr:hypothetical protein NDU88_009249 [Pleurodeles waltl]
MGLMLPVPPRLERQRKKISTEPLLGWRDRPYRRTPWGLMSGRPATVVLPTLPVKPEEHSRWTQAFTRDRICVPLGGGVVEHISQDRHWVGYARGPVAADVLRGIRPPITLQQRIVRLPACWSLLAKHSESACGECIAMVGQARGVSAVKCPVRSTEQPGCPGGMTALTGARGVLVA